MSNKGFSHIGLSTLDLDRTRAFYEDVLGFKPVVSDTLRIAEGGHLRHVFSMSGATSCWPSWRRTTCRACRPVRCRHHRGLGVPAAFYHFAFEAGSEAGLAAKRDQLRAKGVEVTDIVGPRMGQVDLLQGSQRPVARILLPGARPHRG